MVLPRRVTRKVRIARLFYGTTWRFWSGIIFRCTGPRKVETYLGVYGPLSLLILLSIWAGGLIVGFGLIHWAYAAAFSPGNSATGLAVSLYYSGTTFFTLGLGDVTPHTMVGRFLSVVESGLGFGFLALIISYLPVLNQSFGSRETSISMLDARAGSPPTATEMLMRHGHKRGSDDLRKLLLNWERWAAELLESHLSYPVLGYFRSQHENQSWLSALTAVLDISALLISCDEEDCRNQAGLTFAMARHTVVDLAIVFNLPPTVPAQDRITPEELAILKDSLIHEGSPDETIDTGAGFEKKLGELRDMYEPYVHSLSYYFCLPLPPWARRHERKDNWEVSAWQQVNMKKERKGRHF
ncbi:MAG TPA: potassium channel family protein [Syntrophorhabdaceae bacterium]|jgi:hypothetical protein